MMTDQPHSASPRERILDAAHDLFYREGIRATGIDRVIAEAKVTKVTFYRQFASKDLLIEAYLKYRHERWMAWLNAQLAAYPAAQQDGLGAIIETFQGWWSDPHYRGCAFINAAVELGPSSAPVLAIFRDHKLAMQAALLPLLPTARQTPDNAHALALALDGAILHAQAGVPMGEVVDHLRQLIAPLFRKGAE